MHLLDITCTHDKNISRLVDIINDEMNLNPNSLDKCAGMVKKAIRNNIKKLSRAPRNRDECRIIAIHINDISVEAVLESIYRRYPNKQKTRTSQLPRPHPRRSTNIEKEKLERERQVWGDRKVPYQDRPRSQPPKKDLYRDDDADDYSNMMHDGEFSISPYASSSGSYTDAFKPDIITGTLDDTGYSRDMPGHSRDMPSYSRDMPSRSRDTHDVMPDPSRYQTQSKRHMQQPKNITESRYEQMLAERNYGNERQVRPPTPDFSLDGSGSKRSGYQPEYARGMEMDRQPSYNPDPYAELLGGGAPETRPMSSTSDIIDSMGYDNYMYGSESVLGKKLSQDMEYKIAERERMDSYSSAPYSNPLQEPVNPFGQYGAGMRNPLM